MPILNEKTNCEITHMKQLLKAGSCRTGVVQQKFQSCMTPGFRCSKTIPHPPEKGSTKEEAAEGIRGKRISLQLSVKHLRHLHSLKRLYGFREQRSPLSLLVIRKSLKLPIEKESIDNETYTKTVISIHKVSLLPTKNCCSSVH